ncbi:MAG: hypothetical protein HDQ92_00975 [Desulfovibrio sp.]|nr:hypothetical protein [Desulfovibrio sp.]
MKLAKILNFSEELKGKVKKYPLLTRLAVLSLAVIYPYLCYLGGFPAMDEGVYAWTSITYNHNLASGQPLAPLQGFALWPLLLAWIPDLPGLSLLWFRLADMLAALLAGWLLCAILEKECGVYANLLALVVLIFLTNHHVIDNGFKNSFFPAWACLFGATYLILHEKSAGGGVWFLAGALVASGILLRETFFPFAFLGLVAAWHKASSKGAISYILGGLPLALLVIAGLELLAPGSLVSLYKGYADRAVIYGAQHWRILPNLISYGLRSLLLFSPALLLFLVTILWWTRFKAPENDRPSRWQITFWLCVAILPLYEPIIKIGFYYHFAACLPGWAFLAALFAGQPQENFREALQNSKKVARMLLLLGSVAVLGTLASLPNPSNLAQTAEVLARFPDRQWPPSLVPQSTTLQVVDKINKALPNGGTVSTNGCAFFILTAGGLTPPLSGTFDRDDNYFLSDLARFFLNIGGDKKRMKEALLANPPDIIVLMQPRGSHEPSFTSELTEVLKDTGQYEKFATVDPDFPENQVTDYTWVGYDLYRHTAPTTDAFTDK